MAIQSKFFQVTNQALLEYRTDQYKILNTRVATKKGEEATKILMYLGDDGKQYCLEMDDRGGVNNTQTASYIDTATAYRNYYGGKNSVIQFLNEDSYTHSDEYCDDLFVNTENVGSVIKDRYYDSTWYEEKDMNGIRTIAGIDEETGYEIPLTVIHDTIRIYLLSGYVMNNIGGYNLKVKAPVSSVSYIGGNGEIVKRVNDFIYLLNWYMPKEELKDRIHWMELPLYLNSKFYDRYIEVKFPSPLDAATNERNIDYVYECDIQLVDEEGTETTSTVLMRGKIDGDKGVFIDFSTVAYDNIDYTTEGLHTYECSFEPDINSTLVVSKHSNSDYIGGKIYEDADLRAIIYYPTYGDPQDPTTLGPIDMDTMLAIETGVIQLCDSADIDKINEGMDDFIDMYGENADSVFKWIIINELAVTYNYDYIVSREVQADTVIPPITEYYTNTIDFTGKTSDLGKFYISKFVPHIPERPGMKCKSIIISYTAHLYNRVNNIDIIRRASMAITDNPYKFELAAFDTSNIMQYKIVNRIEKNIINVKPAETKDGPGQIVRSYYNITNIMAKTDGDNQSYTQGKLTLYLTHTNNNYLLRLFTTNDDNTRVPLDLSGNTEYKLVFPTVGSGTIEIFPKKDSTNYNLGIGSLIFYITKDKAKTIMDVPASERYFAITTHIQNNSMEETTLYEGNVDWA